MGGVCQFPQGAALFPIWCSLFIAIAMGIVCVWVGGGAGGPMPPPPHFFGGKFNNYLLWGRIPTDPVTGMGLRPFTLQ